MKRHYPKLGAGLVAAALVLSVAPIPPALVDRYYAGLFYPEWQRVITPLSNMVPFALLDVLLLAGTAWLAASLGRVLFSGRRAGRLRPTLRFLGNLAIAGAGLYLVFLFAWGLHYRRLPFTQKVRFDRAAVSPDSALRLAGEAVDRVNVLYSSSRSSAVGALIEPRLAAAFAGTQRALDIERPALPGRPKWTILDLYFRAAGVEGMTDPFFLETLVAQDLLPFERPFVIAHEWSHLAGFADEGEANLVGWLTCVRGPENAQYSGWLFLYGQIAAGLEPGNRARVAGRLAAGPRADLRAVDDRIRRNVSPQISRAGWQVYDRYLRANRVEAGTASYAQVVELILGMQFGADWVPLAR